MKHDLLHIQGKPYVLVPLHEYRQIAADSNESAVAAELPGDILDRLFSKQETPVRVLRRYRGLTQQKLAEAAGLSRPYLTEIEKGAKNGSIKALKAIAQALDVNIGLLTA
jgi:DNA-binding XRE family transcriptional regulator